MKNRSRKTTLALVTAATLAALGGSANVYACSSDPYISSVCVMAFVGARFQNGFGNGTYLPAAGQVLSISNYAALYSLVGTTYGGNGTSTFQLPDLRGRVLVGSGAGPGLPVYNPGNTGGNASVTLAQQNLPVHAHALATQAGGVTVATGVGTLAAATSMNGLNATTSLASVTATASGTGLALNAAAAPAATGNSSGAALASAGLTRIYAGTTPNVAMSAGSISGSAPVTFSGNPTTTISGNPTTTLSGAPAVTISGMTGVAGGGAPFSTMPPYLSMQYFIAVQGLFPSGN